MPATEQEHIFRYGQIRAYILGSGLLIMAGGGFFFILGLFRESLGFSPAKLFGGLGLFFLALTPIFNTQFRINRNGIGRIRGKREVFIPWSELDVVRFRGSDVLILRSANSKIKVDKQVDEYLLLYAVIRKFAPPHVWEQLSFPVRARGQLIGPFLLWIFCGGSFAVMKFLTNYSPPQNPADRVIVFIATYWVVPLVLLGIWLATNLCEFTASQIRVGLWAKRKTYAVAEIAEMYLGSVDIGKKMEEEYPLYWGVKPYGVFEDLTIRFRDGSELSISNREFSINVEVLFEFLSQHYHGAKTQAQESV